MSRESEGRVDELETEKATPIDELVEWAATMQQGARTASPELRPIEESLPELAPRLHRRFQQALEYASGGSLHIPAEQARILWAPRRIMVTLGKDAFEIETDGTAESLDEALVTAAHSLWLGSHEF